VTPATPISNPSHRVRELSTRAGWRELLADRCAGTSGWVLRAAGLPELRAAHAPLFMVIDPTGTRVTELADRMRMTKQAAGELIRSLAERGYLQVSPGTTDGRVSIVTLTDRGWDAVRTGDRVVAAFDQWLDQRIGAEQVDQLRRTLTAIATATSAHWPSSVPEGQARG